jgi:hypothetical protein
MIPAFAGAQRRSGEIFFEAKNCGWWSFQKELIV